MHQYHDRFFKNSPTSPYYLTLYPSSSLFLLRASQKVCFYKYSLKIPHITARKTTGIRRALCWYHPESQFQYNQIKIFQRWTRKLSTKIVLYSCLFRPFHFSTLRFFFIRTNKAKIGTLYTTKNRNGRNEWNSWLRSISSILSFSLTP